jgi:putative DNA primase/helicase
MDIRGRRWRAIGHVFRFDIADREKTFRPLTLWRDAADGNLHWRWESWPIERPLYGLRELAERPSAVVVVCEGEKSADAARRLLPGFVVVTSPHGSENADKADWSALQGREAIIWPDADIPGHKYAQAVTDMGGQRKLGSRRFTSYGSEGMLGRSRRFGGRVDI